MITKVPLQIATVCAAVILGGVFMGNMVMLYAGSLILVYLFTGFNLQQPKGVTVERLHHDTKLEVDDRYTFHYRITVKDGTGPVTIGVNLSNQLKLVEGNNFVTLWKNKAPLEEDIVFTVKCQKRGIYETGEAAWETRHPLGFTNTLQGTVNDPVTLMVYPKHHNIRRIRDKKIYSNMPVPTEALIQMGTPTTDFKDIREYQIGDPYRTINWKATARRAHHQFSPMVNEYEKEGRKTIWIFMNTASRMQTGNTINNCFEYAIHAVLELSAFYLNRNCQLGFSLYNDDYPPGSIGFLHRNTQQEATPRYEYRGILPPETGTQQFIKIRERLMYLRPSSLFPSLSEALDQAQSYIKGAAPLIILITIVDQSHLETLREDLEKINIRESRRPPVLLVHIIGYELLNYPDQVSRLRYLDDVQLIEQANSIIPVVQWNPTRELLNEAIIAQVNK